MLDLHRRGGSAGVAAGGLAHADHFYLASQAALDGLDLAMGPTALVADDLADGRLVSPFAGVTLPTRGYHAYLPDTRAGDLSATAFCRWLEEVGRAEPSTFPR